MRGDSDRERQVRSLRATDSVCADYRSMTHEISLRFANLGEELRDLKLSVIKEVGIECTSFKLTLEEPLPEALVWASRVFHMDHIEVYFLHSVSCSPLDRIKTIVSPQNELRSLTFLMKEVTQVADPVLRNSVLLRFNSLLHEYSQYVSMSFNPQTRPTLTSLLQEHLKLCGDVRPSRCAKCGSQAVV